MPSARTPGSPRTPSPSLRPSLRPSFQPSLRPSALALSLWLAAGTASLVATASLAQEISRASLRATVVDSKTREPLGQVRVLARRLPQGPSREAQTDAQGRVELIDLADGRWELVLGSVGYGRLVRQVALTAGQALELSLALGPEAVKPAAEGAQQVVTVTGRIPGTAAPELASVYTLSNTELQNLSTVLANDPLRALQSLPGVTANQDFYGQFAVRGAGPSRVGVVIDGVLLDNAFHGFTDKGDLGSVSILSGALVDSSTLYSGVAPARLGGRLGGMVEVETREGSRDERFTRVEVDMLSTTVTQEGPLGAERRGSYLVSARKSYLDYLMSKLKNNSGALGYSDLDLKLDYQLSATDHLSLTTVLGSSSISRGEQPNNPQALGFLTEGSGHQGFSTLRWVSQISPTTRLKSQLFWARDSQVQRNPDGDLLLSTRSTQIGLREEWTQMLSNDQTLEASLSLRQRQTQREESSIWDFNAGRLATSLVPVADFTKTAQETGASVQDSLKLMDDRLKLRAGARWDHSSANRQSVFLPSLDASWALNSRTQLAAALGQTAQFPSLDQLYGQFGTPGLKAERATTAALSLDQDLSQRWRLHAEWYQRRESNVIDSRQAQFRLTSDGSYALPSPGAVLTNGLNGRAQGVEIRLQRQSANGFSGWLAVSRSQMRYTPTDGSASFWGDQDQRTTVSAYGAYRWSDTLSFSANARYGSGTPVPGYLGSGTSGSGRGDETLVSYALSPSLNTQRAAAYQRLDLRVNKVYYGANYKLTLKAEIANVLGHNNWRYYDYLYPEQGSAQTVGVTRNTTMPRLPTVGLSLEF